MSSKDWFATIEFFGMALFIAAMGWLFIKAGEQ